MLLGVDVGGTFTDAALLDGERLTTAKAPTTPDDQSEGVLAAVDAVMAAAGAEPDKVVRFVHGMTVGTNALLEGRVARTALLATEGFTDLEELGRQTRAELYRLCVGNPPPLVPTDLRVPVPERCGPGGELRPLDRDELRRRLGGIEAPEAFAVCLLWGFRHPEHEQAAGTIAREAHPDAHVSLSHETAAIFREYERCATTIVDAALSPLLREYLERLAERATGAGLPPPEVMLSSGGVAGAPSAARHGSWTVLSGPAGGAVGAGRAAAHAGATAAVCLDMGGTSCDVCVAEDGVVGTSGGREVGGRALALPMVDVHTVGAGGGSIAWRDEGGALRVGPRSAGAIPGPACYGRGGELPTVTDANLVLGRLDAGSPLAGGVALDRQASERVVAELGAELGLSSIETALGIVRVAAAGMAQAVRVMTVERGIDPRGMTLVAFGGAGPLHATDIAGQLEMTNVVIPPASGVLSALGLVISERRRDLARSVLLTGDALSRDAVSVVVAELAAAGREELEAPGAEIRCSYDLRYRGQAFELGVGGPPEPDPEELRRAFDRRHAERYGYSDPDAALELVTVRVAVAEPGGAEPSGQAQTAEPAGARPVWFDSGKADAEVLRGIPERADGPAVCELPESTAIVPPGWSGRRSDSGALVLESSGR